MLPEIRPLPSTSKTSPGRRVSLKAVESPTLNDSQWLSGFCNRATKRPTMSNIQPMTRSGLLVFSRRAVPALLPFGCASYTASLPMEMDRTIVRRVIRTLRSVEKGIPRFRIGHLGRCVRTHRSLDKDAPVSSGSAEWNHLFTADTRRTSFALRQASGFLDVGVSKVSQSAATRDLPLGPESITGFTIVSA